jgi:hypothetical protein
MRSEQHVTAEVQIGHLFCEPALITEPRYITFLEQASARHRPRGVADGLTLARSSS